MSNRDNHAPRDTTTGKINEDSIGEFLHKSLNVPVYLQTIVGTQFNTKKQHIVDAFVGGKAYKKEKKAKRWISEIFGTFGKIIPTEFEKVFPGELHSFKYQAIDGTAEEKIPFEFLKLQDAIDKYGYTGGVIVLCGESGWTLKEYYLSEEFRSKMKLIAADVTVMTEETYRQQLTSN